MLSGATSWFLWCPLEINQDSISSRLTLSRRSMTRSKFLIIGVAVIALNGCRGAEYHRGAVSPDRNSALTVGTVQREIRVGMSGADVASVLGAPNLVTSDEERRETWVYDKISTERAYSADSGGISTLVLGGASVGDGLVGGGVGPSFGFGSGASSTTQKTLTVIIKFGADKRVRDFAYHSSQF
jgi:outer membrane protein assembly factor BamE (lipoprotein component of BamABCDE complex)